MYTTCKINSCEYYLRADERGDRTSYYVDADPTGLDGETQTWFVPPPNTPIVNGMAAFAMDGAAVVGDDLRALAAGRHPITQQPLTQRRDIAGRKPVVGQDCTFSAPKSVSVLYAIGTPEQRREIRMAQEAAVRRALSFMHNTGLVRTRRGSGSKRTEAAAHWVGGIFHHSTSRPQDGMVGDPQIHSHVIIPAVVQRADGTTGSLDNSALLTHAGCIGGVFRAELAAQLKSRLGIECEREGRNFRVAGCSQEADDAFSKRRSAVVEAMGGRDTAINRAAAQKATLMSRTGKMRATAAELQASWTAQLAAIGHDARTIAASVVAGGEMVRAKCEQAETAMREMDGADDLTDDELRCLALDALAVSAIKDCFAHDAVCPRRKLLLAVERFQGVADADTALAAIDKAMSSLVEIGVDKDGDRVWTTPELIAAERSLLLNSVGRLDEREWIPAAAIEAAIAAKVGISEEQADAVRHLCNRDGVSVLVGSAGSGKSWSSQCVVEAARLAGEHGGTRLKCYAIAPSWAATDVVRSDADVSEAMAAAVAAFVARVQNGRIVLDTSSLIVVDEAGMIGTEQMAQLLEIAKKSKVCLMGDPLQLQPVSAGSPLKLIASRCGEASIRRIKRQQSDWQRAASERFAKGDCSAILDFDDRGFVHWCDGKDDPEDGDGAMQRLAADWAAHVAEHPDFDERGRRTRLCLASRNADVHRLNALLRAEWKAAGRLGTEEYVLKSVHRGQNSSPQEIRISVGDSLIWGERIELRGQPIINNSDGCTVLAIGGDPADPTLTIRLDKGGEVTALWSQYVGKAKHDAPAGPRVPRCQAYYCATIHQSQGRTVRDTFVLNAAAARGLGAESTYVGLTRHTTSCQMYVDSSALIDRIPDGDPGLSDEQEQARVRAGLRNILVEDSNRSESKTNVAEFAADTSLRSFMESGDLAAVPTPAELIRRRLDAVPARKEPAILPPKPALRTAEQSKQEVEHWRRMDLGAFLVKEDGWNGKTAANGRTWTLRKGDGKGAEELACKRMDNGRWAYTSRNGAEHGDLFGYLSARHGLGFAEACKWLRDRGYGHSSVPWWPPPPPPPRPDGPLTMAELSPDDRRNVVRIGVDWAAARRGWTERLTAIRRLSEATLSYFASHIRTIGAADIFAHRFSDGTVSGWEEKHPKGALPDGRTGSFAKGGRRCLFRGGNTTAPTSIRIFEAAIDAMSHHELYPDPAAMYLSMGGNVTDGVRREITALVKKHPGVAFRLCVDADKMGAVYRADLTAVIRDADADAVVIEDPPSEGKDWNDILVAVRVREDGFAAPPPEPTTAPMTPPPTTRAPVAADPLDWLAELPAIAPPATAAPPPPPTAPVALTTKPAPVPGSSWLDDLADTTPSPTARNAEDEEDAAMAARLAAAKVATHLTAPTTEWTP